MAEHLPAGLGCSRGLSSNIGRDYTCVAIASVHQHISEHAYLVVQMHELILRVQSAAIFVVALLLATGHLLSRVVVVDGTEAETR